MYGITDLLHAQGLADTCSDEQLAVVIAYYLAVHPESHADSLKHNIVNAVTRHLHLEWGESRGLFYTHMIKCIPATKDGGTDAFKHQPYTIEFIQGYRSYIDKLNLLSQEETQCLLLIPFSTKN